MESVRYQLNRSLVLLHGKSRKVVIHGVYEEGVDVSVWAEVPSPCQDLSFVPNRLCPTINGTCFIPILQNEGHNSNRIG